MKRKSLSTNMLRMTKKPKKRCARCKAEKPTSEFHRLVSSRDGLQYRCKACVAEVCGERWRRGETTLQRMEKQERRRVQAFHMRNWRKKNPEKNKAYIAAAEAKNPEKYRRAKANATLRFNFGITLDQYESMLASQNGVCAICKRPQRHVASRLAVDHCHLTGKVRGLLCTPCNRALGVFEDSQELLESALAYIRSHQ